MTLSDTNLDWTQNPDKNIPIVTPYVKHRKIHKPIDPPATFSGVFQEPSNVALCMERWGFVLERLQDFQVFYGTMKTTVPAELLLPLFLSQLQS